MLQPRKPEPPTNGVVSYHVGEPKTPAYEGFRVVDSRKLPRAVIALADEAAYQAWWYRLMRVRREQGFQFSFQAIAYLRDHPETEPDPEPVIDLPEWTVHSDTTLTGEDVAEVLGLDDEWRTVLGVAPNTALSCEQFKRLANVALIRSYMETVNEKFAELDGFDPPPRPTLQDAARVLDDQRRQPHPEGTVRVADEKRQAAFDAAARNCIYDEHPAGCSFGGMTVHSLYWLAAEDCPLPHGDGCAWCGAECTTGFSGWEEGHEGDDNHRYLVPACEPCGEEWARLDPRWKKPDA